MKKYFTLLGTAVVVLLLLMTIVAFAVNFKTKKFEIREYIGKVTVEIRSNEQQIDQMMGGITILLSKKYMLEYNRLIRSSDWDSVSQKAITYKPGDPGYMVLQNYAVTDMSTGVLVQFDTNLVSPKVVACMPAAKKDRGFMPNGQKEMDLIANVVSGFTYNKDTIIDKVNYKVLTYSKRERVRNSVVLEKGVAYLNPGMRDFPIRISHHLDRKYGGWVNRLDLWLKDTISGRNEKVVTALKFSTHLTPKESNVMRKLIPIAKAYLDTANLSQRVF